MVDPANFASEIKGIYNIENNNAYREIHATMENSGRLRSDIFALSSDISTTMDKCNPKIYVEYDSDGTKNVSFKYNKTTAPEKNDKNTTYNFPQIDGKICNIHSADSAISIFFSDDNDYDFYMYEATQNSINRYNYTYDEFGNPITQESIVHKDDFLEKDLVLYMGKSRTETKTVESRDTDTDSAESTGANYKLNSKTELKYDGDKLVYEYRDTDGDGNNEYIESYEGDDPFEKEEYINGMNYKEIHKDDDNNPDNNHEINRWSEKDCKFETIHWENHPEKDTETVQHKSDDGRTTIWIDKKGNDNRNIFQSIWSSIKSGILGDNSDYDEIIVKDIYGNETEHEYLIFDSARPTI